MKQYIGISRDHSGSMMSLTRGAMNDYNQTVEAIREASSKQGIDTIVSTVKCGVRGGNNGVEREVINSSINALKPLTSYSAESQTPLFDSVLELIEILEAAPDKDADDVSFLIMAITDGAENGSRRINGMRLGQKMMQLQNTDKWTFIFRVPRGYGRYLEGMGIPSGNILEWDQSERGIAVSTAATKQAFDNFYQKRSAGVKSSKSFYADLSNVSVKDLKQNLVEITNDVEIWQNQTSAKMRIDDLVNSRLTGGKTYVKGNAFYQLTKREDEVQDYKKIVIRDKKTWKVYGGDVARQMLGLPNYGTVKLIPKDHNNYEIFIQSTSMNRNIPEKAKVLYWEQN